jgi:glycosyltransferase involved in cell wall biosynthesis
MPKCVVYTSAYNAEQTLALTVNSMQAQTYKDWVWYIVDNGSTDETGKLIREYAREDSRIIPLANKKNHVWEKGNTCWSIISEYQDDDCFCWLDADDAYKPEFLLKMIAFLKDNRLDIAICGYDFVDTITNLTYSVRKLESDLILDNSNAYDEYFTLYHPLIRTIWAKLYKISVFKDFDRVKINSVAYGWDTYLVLESLRCASRVGFLAKSLHEYNVSPKSLSYRFDERRIASDRLLLDATKEFLVSKCGSVSKKNSDFLFLVYHSALGDTFSVLVSSKLGAMDKIERLGGMLKSSHTQELVRWLGPVAQQDKLFLKAADWLLSQEEVRCGEGMDTAADLLAAIGVYPAAITGWPDSLVFLLLAKIQNRLAATDRQESVHTRIISITAKSPLLCNLDYGFLLYFRDIAYSVLQKDEMHALRQIEDMIAREIDLPDEYAQDFITLGQNIAAKLEQADDFIYLKKLLISMLIENSGFEKAREELADWDMVLPDDLDFRAFRATLSQ